MSMLVMAQRPLRMRALFYFLYTPLPSGDRTAEVPGSGPGLTHVGVHLGSPPAERVTLGKVSSATGPQFPQLQNRDSPFCSLTGRLSGLNGATHL